MAKISKTRAAGYQRQILEHLHKRTPALEVQEQIGLADDQATFADCLAAVLDNLGSELAGKPVEHQYAEFWIETMADMRELATLKWHEPKDRIAALKLRGELRKDIIKVGKDLGVITSGDSSAVGGMINLNFINNLSNKEIRLEMEKTANELLAIHKKFGDSPFSEVEVPEVFTGPSEFDLKALESET